MNDVFDLPALRKVMTGINDRTIRVEVVETQKASPFAQSLLFGWIATYMYEGDAPLAERRAAALALDKDLLSELLGAEELRDLLDADVMADLELSSSVWSITERPEMRTRSTMFCASLARSPCLNLPPG